MSNPSDFRIDRVDQCKVIWYQWVNELPTSGKDAFKIKAPFPVPPVPDMSDEALGATRDYDISNHIANLTYSKSIGDAAGSFSFTLYNSFDWVRFIKAGQWIMVYLAGDGSLAAPDDPMQQDSSAIPTFAANKLNPTGSAETSDLPFPPSPDDPKSLDSKRRFIGVIQRVAVKSSTNVDGTVETVYTVSGKDFGVIYEETEIWFNMHNSEENTFASAIGASIYQKDRKLSNLLDKMHDAFLSQDTFFDASSPAVANSSYAVQQWAVPSGLIDDLNLDSWVTYFGDIMTLKNFSETPFQNPTPNFLDGLSGNCWDRLKNFSQPEFHELFTELTDFGQPELIFRMLPWGLDTSNYPTLAGFAKSYKSLTEAAPPQLPIPRIPGMPARTSRLSDNISITALQVESFDVGPDQHSRANLFLVDNMRSAFDQKNATALVGKLGTPWPFRDNNDIKRHGLKPLIINLVSYNLDQDTNLLFGALKAKDTSADLSFILEANHMIRDIYCNAEDMYSGTINLMTGLNETRLGKVIITDDSFNGISNMVFYIEGYVDNFDVNQDGTCTWSQTLHVTRGLNQEVLYGADTKEGTSAYSGTFSQTR